MNWEEALRRMRTYSRDALYYLYVVARDRTLTEADIRAHCKEHLTGYKVPKRVEFRDELPKSNVGKILRKDLRAEELARIATKSAAE